MREGIDWTALEFRDNQAVIDLIAKPPRGLFSVIDEQYRTGAAASDGRLLSALHQAHAAGQAATPHPNYQKPKFAGAEFTVLHFAGPVTYQVEGMLAKNRDTLHADLRGLLHTCEAPLLKQRFAALAAREAADASSATGPGAGGKLSGRRTTFGAGGGPAKMADSAGLRFKSSMAELAGALNACQPHFVRCVKPNETQQPSLFEFPLARHQLLCLGVMETVRIRQEGYPVRREFGALLEQFEILHRSRGLAPPLPAAGPVAAAEAAAAAAGAAEAAEEGAGDEDGGAARRGCRELLGAWLAAGSWQIGKHRAFLRDGCLAALNRHVAATLFNAARRLQTRHRTRAAQAAYGRSLVASRLLSRLGRGLGHRQQWRRQRKAQQMMARHARGRARRVAYAQQQAAGVRLHAAARGFITRRCNGNASAATTVLQKLVRGRQGRRAYELQREAATLFANLARRRAARKGLAAARWAATRLAATARARREKRAFNGKRGAVTALATAVRGRRDRLAFGESKQAAVALQTALRGTAARSQLTRSRRAATRVATAARGRQARAEFQTAKGAAVRLQGNLRRHQARQLLGGVTEARAPFLHLLHANEMVLLEALVLRQEKKASLLGGSGKKRRRLILTSGPRLLLVDPERVAGGAAEVPLEFDRGEYGRRRFAVVHAPNFELRPAGMARCDAAGASVGSALEAGVGQAGLAEGVDAFVCLVGEASALVGLLEDALDALVRGVWLEAAGGSAAVPLSSPLAVRSFAEEAAGRMLPVRRQGYLTKRALKSKMNWRKRWCV